MFPHSVSSTQPAAAQHSPLFDWSILQSQEGLLSQEGRLALCALPCARCGIVMSVTSSSSSSAGRGAPRLVWLEFLGGPHEPLARAILVTYPKSLEYLRLSLVYCNTKDNPLQSKPQCHFRRTINLLYTLCPEISRVVKRPDEGPGVQVT